MIQQHNLLIRPSHLVCPSPASLLHSLPKRPSTEHFSGFAFYGGQGLLPAGQILVVLLRSRGILFLLPLLGSGPHRPWAWGSLICNPSALVCPTQSRCSPLSWASRQSGGSAVGSGSAADSRQLPWGWWINTPELNSPALWHPELTFHSVRHLIL